MSNRLEKLNVNPVAAANSFNSASEICGAMDHIAAYCHRIPLVNRSMI